MNRLNFWNKVLKYRELGLDVLLQDIQRGKDEKKQIKLDIKIEKSEEWYEVVINGMGEI